MPRVASDPSVAWTQPKGQGARLAPRGVSRGPWWRRSWGGAGWRSAGVSRAHGTSVAGAICATWGRVGWGSTHLGSLATFFVTRGRIRRWSGTARAGMQLRAVLRRRVLEQGARCTRHLACVDGTPCHVCWFVSCPEERCRAPNTLACRPSCFGSGRLIYLWDRLRVEPPRCPPTPEAPTLATSPSAVIRALV